MSEKIYDGKSSIKLPSGRVITKDEMQNEAFYRQLANDVCVINVNEAGVMSSYILLADMKEQYGVTESDPETALQKCIEERERRKQEAEKETVTLADMQEQMNALTSAFMTEGVANA